MNALAYAGDVSPEEAWRLLRDRPEAQLVDVRSEAEWAFVGLPDLSALGKEPVLIAWQSFPGMAQNPRFGAMLGQAAAERGAGAEAPLIFLCRSGARSRSAAVAATQAGFSNAFNLAGGFEGDPDPEGHRGVRNGWKASGLPWRQS